MGPNPLSSCEAAVNWGRVLNFFFFLHSTYGLTSMSTANNSPLHVWFVCGRITGCRWGDVVGVFLPVYLSLLSTSGGHQPSKNTPQTSDLDQGKASLRTEAESSTTEASVTRLFTTISILILRLPKPGPSLSVRRTCALCMQSGDRQMLEGKHMNECEWLWLGSFPSAALLSEHINLGNCKEERQEGHFSLIIPGWGGACHGVHPSALRLFCPQWYVLGLNGKKKNFISFSFTPNGRNHSCRF